MLENISYDILKNINYKFREGSITSIIGRSGSGKSLLGLLLMNMISNYDGKIIVNNRIDYDIYDYLRKVGYVSQMADKHFVCELVKDEISFGLRQYNYKLDKEEKQIKDSLKMVGLSDAYLDRNVTSLSASEKVKVAIASSLVMNPEVLLLDNVTTYLDSDSKKELLNLLLKLKDKFNKSIIFISSDMDFVYSLGNDYILLNDGKIVKSGSVLDFLIDDDMFNRYDLEIPKIIRLIKLMFINKKVDLNKIKNVDDIVREVINKNG